MRRTWTRVFVASVLIPFVAYSALLAVGLVGAWIARSRAEHLLASVRFMQIGVTSEADFQAVMAGYRGGQLGSLPGRKYDTEGASINVPRFLGNICEHIPDGISQVFRRCGPFLVTGFFVTPTFDRGKLVRLMVEEDTEGKDGVHPIVAQLIEHARGQARYEGLDPQSEFTGYSVSSMLEERGDANGLRVGEVWSARLTVEMDDRATKSERDAAYDFDLSCFTRVKGCQDATLLLHVSVQDGR